MHAGGYSGCQSLGVMRAWRDDGLPVGPSPADATGREGAMCMLHASAC